MRNAIILILISQTIMICDGLYEMTYDNLGKGILITSLNTIGLIINVYVYDGVTK